MSSRTVSGRKQSITRLVSSSRSLPPEMSPNRRIGSNHGPRDPSNKVKDLVIRVKRHFMNHELAYHFFMLICLTMFIYQSIMILMDYLEFKSVKVKVIENEIPRQTPSPAITFCLDDFLSFKTIEKLAPEAITKFNQINEDLVKSNNSTQDFILNQQLENYMNQNQIRMINRLTINQAFDRSVNFNHYIDDCLIIKQNGTIPCPFLDFSKKIEYMQETQKCTTYLYEVSDRVKLSLGEKIVFIFGEKNNPEESFMQHFGQELKIRMQVTPQYYLPEASSEFNDLVYGYFYELSYWRTTTHLEQTPIKPICYDYSVVYKTRSKNECFFDCVNMTYRKSSNICIPTDIMIKREKEDKNITICENQSCDEDSTDCYLNLLHDAYAFCENHCLPDCTEITVNQILTKIVLKDFQKDARKYLMLSITPRKGLRDHFYVNQVMTFQKFVSNIGGIGGIWLGLNVFAIYQYLSHLIHKLCHHFSKERTNGSQREITHYRKQF